jgi:hypothetical protein
MGGAKWWPKGGGWSNLWRYELAARWAWFIRKVFSFFKTENPLLWVGSNKTTYGHKADITAAFDVRC